MREPYLLGFSTDPRCLRHYRKGLDIVIVACFSPQPRSGVAFSIFYKPRWTLTAFFMGGEGPEEVEGAVDKTYFARL